MSGRLPRLAGVVATVDTADEGYFFGFLVDGGDGAVLNSVLAGSANRVHVWQFVLPFRIVVRNITWNLIVGVNGSNSSMGIYDPSGNLLLHTGAVSTEIADQGYQKTSLTGVILEPGVYFFAHTSTSISVLVKTWSLGIATWGPHLNQGSALRLAKAANDSSSGVLPATLGTLTVNTGINPPIGLFEP